MTPDSEHGAPRGRTLQRDDFVRVCAPIVDACGYDVESLEVVDRPTPVVRIVVDADMPITIDGVADVSRLLSEAIDKDPSLSDDPFELEVTTPGIDRPLTCERHYRRALGRKVHLTTTSGDHISGRIGTLTDGESAPVAVQIVTNNKGRFSVATYPLGSIDTAVVQVDFSTPGAHELALCGIDPHTRIAEPIDLSEPAADMANDHNEKQER